MSNLKYKHTAYTSAQWASLNPVIVENEIVIESDTKRTKIGNGISTYNELEYADANSVGNSLGSIKPTDAAPTPALNGNYTFSIGGNKPAWLTAEAGITEVKAGDGVAVVFTAPSSYTYTHVDVSSDFVTRGGYIGTASDLANEKADSPLGLNIFNNRISVVTYSESAKLKNSISDYRVYNNEGIIVYVAATGITTSYKMTCKPSTKYTLSTEFLNANYRIETFNASGSIVAQLGGNASPNQLKSFTTGADVVAVLFCCDSSFFNTFSIQEGDIATTGENYYGKYVESLTYEAYKATYATDKDLLYTAIGEKENRILGLNIFNKDIGVKSYASEFKLIYSISNYRVYGSAGGDLTFTSALGINTSYAFSCKPSTLYTISTALTDAKEKLIGLNSLDKIVEFYSGTSFTTASTVVKMVNCLLVEKIATFSIQEGSTASSGETYYGVAATDKYVQSQIAESELETKVELRSEIKRKTLTYTTDVATTRKLILLSDRSHLLEISYTTPNETITERYKGLPDVSGNIYDSEWTTDGNWERIVDSTYLSVKTTELNNKIVIKKLTYTTSSIETRKLILLANRQYGLCLTYVHPTYGLIIEQYKGTASLNDYDWTFEANWKRVVYSDEIYIGETVYRNYGATMQSVSDTLDETIFAQTYLGGYIEIQPDSWDGTNAPTDDTSLLWGVPHSLIKSEQLRLRELVFPGNGKGIMYVRFPLGFAYRGYRNIDSVSGLARNVGERYAAQNPALKRLLEKVSDAGGGLSPEYWCPAPHWLTTGQYSNATNNNYLSAGGSYPRSVSLDSIRVSDPTQYNNQIDEFTDAIINDLEYIHLNVAPVRMFSLQNEPQIGKTLYGACIYDKYTYKDVLDTLWPKVLSSEILSIYNNEINEVKLYVASESENFFLETGVGYEFITNGLYKDYIWGYSWHGMRFATGEDVFTGESTLVGANMYKSNGFAAIKGTKENVFINEYEYFENGIDLPTALANNILHLINELVYSGAKLLHPIIHVMKPIGQLSSSTNTIGYGLLQMNLSGEYGADFGINNPLGLNKGTFMPVYNNYNSWAIFGDNIPIGSVVIGGEPSANLLNFGWVALKGNGRIYIIMANRSSVTISFTLNFSSSKRLKGKLYNMSNCGASLENKFGSSITVIIPAFSGIIYEEIQ